jgi:hypothetical protein
MTEREFKRAQRIAMYGSNIPKSGQRAAYAQAEATAAKRGAAIEAGFTPPTAAATGDLLKRRLELFKSMQDVGREEAAGLAEEAAGLQISRSGFRQALNRIPIAGTTPAGTTPAGTTPAGTTPAGTTPAGTTPAGTTPAGTTPAGTTPAGTTPAVDIPPVIVTPKNEYDRDVAAAFGLTTSTQPAGTTIPDPKSREGQKALMLQTIKAESGKGESNADILRRLNAQRVAQGQAPLRIKLTEPKKFPVDTDLTNALFGGMRFRPDKLQ